MKLVNTSKAVYTYDDSGKMIGMNGENKMGEFGYIFDSKGLCEHERIKKWCIDCQEASWKERSHE